MTHIVLDGSAIRDREGLHALLAERLSLPEHYGRNLDALHDCLTDKRDVTVFLRNAGAMTADTAAKREPITKADLYHCGLSGGDGSREARRRLLQTLDLPEHMSANALLQALNVLYEREEFLAQYSTLGDKHD